MPIVYISILSTHSHESLTLWESIKMSPFYFWGENTNEHQQSKRKILAATCYRHMKQICYVNHISSCNIYMLHCVLYIFKQLITYMWYHMHLILWHLCFLYNKLLVSFRGKPAHLLHMLHTVKISHLTWAGPSNVNKHRKGWAEFCWTYGGE